jgi:hypothetical protein
MTKPQAQHPLTQNNTETKTVMVVLRTAWGVTRAYPANAQAALFAKLAGKATLNRTDFQDIEALGFHVEATVGPAQSNLKDVTL